MDTSLKMKNIVKEFPGVVALKDVSFTAYKGEVHGLVGENGAGKSTLVKVLSGVYPHSTFAGELIVKGKIVRFANTKEAEQAGIAIIHQELNLIPELSVAENIFLGKEPVKPPLNFINRRKMNADSKEILGMLDVELSPRTPIKNLTIGKQQLVEIAKALSINAEILVFDEPTSALTERETKTLFKIIGELKKHSVTIIYISHKLDEVFQICNRVTVLRDGETVATHRLEELNKDKLISLMVGRELINLYPKRSVKLGEEAIRVESFSVNHPFLIGEKMVKEVSFTARRGEILGISGLMGSGRSELVTAIFGAFPADTEGSVYIEGKKSTLRSPYKAIQNGLGLVPEDRKQFGLILIMTVGENISLASLEKVSELQFINKEREKKLIDKYISELNIKTTSAKAIMNTLSGGNQQKVVISKWLANSPKVLVLDEPTRGVDVGARYEIYQIMNKLVEEGVCIVMISSDLSEILGMSDRIIVMHEGKITGQFHKGEANQEKIMLCATGEEKNPV